jgi:sulfatase modifying factor 1
MPFESLLAATIVRLVVAGLSLRSFVGAPATVPVGPGTYEPLQPDERGAKQIAVAEFRLDRFAVTNAQYLRFVRAAPQWRRTTIDPLFADAHYLEHWAGPLDLGDEAPADAPVVDVSWFSAKAYCASLGERLPREAEWELAAMASRRKRDGRKEEEWREQILAWYAARPTRVLRDVSTTEANAWGVHGLHGVIWEWVYDFNASLVSEDGRAAGGRMTKRFCGGGALSAVDPADYASFMRVAFRSALTADSTTGSLGFRCAADARKETP